MACPQKGKLRQKTVSFQQQSSGLPKNREEDPQDGPPCPELLQLGGLRKAFRMCDQEGVMTNKTLLASHNPTAWTLASILTPGLG